MKLAHRSVKKYTCALCKVTFAAITRYKQHFDEFHILIVASEEQHLMSSDSEMVHQDMSIETEVS